MLLTAKRLVAVALLVCSMNVFADASANVDENSVNTAAEASSSDVASETSASDAAAHVHWDFLACTHDDHECSHLAQRRGYQHHRAVHDDNRCRGHRHYACWGGHH